jgi:protein-tyrosine phosphatase
VRYPIADGLSTLPAPALDELPGLRADGVDVLVSLLPADQATALGLAGERAAAEAAGLEFVSFPIPDFGVPDRAEAEPVLQRLAADRAAGRHVAVHCWGGVGRSSLVAAALLVRAGATPAEAWARVAAARGVPVPETDAQREWVVPPGIT